MDGPGGKPGEGSGLYRGEAWPRIAQVRVEHAPRGAAPEGPVGGAAVPGSPVSPDSVVPPVSPGSVALPDSVVPPVVAGSPVIGILVSVPADTAASAHSTFARNSADSTSAPGSSGSQSVSTR